MATSASELLRGWFEDVWNAGRTDLISVRLAPAAPVHGLDGAGGAVLGPAGFRGFFDGIRGSFADIRFELLDVMEAGPMAAGRWTATVTHVAEAFGVPATNHTVTVTGMTMIRAEGGQIAEAWNEWDRSTLLMTIGAIRPASPP